MKTRHQGEFPVQFRASLSVIKVYGLFSNGVLTYWFGKQPRATAIACIVLVTSDASLNNNL